MNEQGAARWYLDLAAISGRAFRQEAPAPLLMGCRLLAGVPGVVEKEMERITWVDYSTATTTVTATVLDWMEEGGEAPGERKWQVTCQHGESANRRGDYDILFA